MIRVFFHANITVSKVKVLDKANDTFEDVVIENNMINNGVSFMVNFDLKVLTVYDSFYTLIQYK